MADTLPNIVATLVVTSPEDGNEQEVKIVSIHEIYKEDRCQPLINYLEHGKLPSESRHKIEVHRRALHFLSHKGTLYQCSFLSLCLRYVDDKERKQVMEETHANVCSVH